MAFPYTKRYAGGFSDLPAKTTAIDSQYLNAVEAALIALCGAAPSADYVPIWNAVDGQFEPAKLKNAQIDAAAAIAISKLAGFPNDVTKALLGDGTWSTFASGAGVDGWSSISATLAYSSVDGPIFVATTSSDLTALIPVGARLKLTQSATVKYFIVHAISSTTITLYGGTDFTLANSTISAPSYSLVKVPVGFNSSPVKWTETLTDTTNRSQGSPTSGTWYNPGAGVLSLSIPIGIWNAEYQASLGGSGGSGTTDSEVQIYATLSTTNSSQSDQDWTVYIESEAEIVTTGDLSMRTTVSRRKPIVAASKTPYFLNAKVANTGMAAVAFYGGAGGSTIIRAVDAYL